MSSIPKKPETGERGHSFKTFGIRPPGPGGSKGPRRVSYDDGLFGVSMELETG